MVPVSSISAINGTGLSIGFTKLLISSLESKAEYRIQLYPKGFTQDTSEYLNWFTTTDEILVTTK